MKNEDKKKISGRPFLIFLITFLSLVAFLTIMAFFAKEFPNSLGNHYLYGGSIVALIGFTFINKGGNRGDRGGAARYIKNDKLFKTMRAEERPFERIIWSVIFAGLSIAAIGYLLILIG